MTTRRERRKCKANKRFNRTDLCRHVSRLTTNEPSHNRRPPQHLHFATLHLVPASRRVTVPLPIWPPPHWRCCFPEHWWPCGPCRAAGRCPSSAASRLREGG